MSGIFRPQGLRVGVLSGTALALLLVASSCKRTPTGAAPGSSVASGTNTANRSTASSGSGEKSSGSGGGVLGGLLGKSESAPGSFKLRDMATKYDVTYTPETVQFSADAALGALLSVTDDGATYTFDASSSDAKKLHAGSVMLLSGIALRKVTSTSQTADGIVVKTENAEITDAIQDGTIESKMPVDFGSMQTAANTEPVSPVRRRSFLPTVYAGNTKWTSVPPALAGKSTGFTAQIDPFSYKVAFTPAPGQLNITMTVMDTTTTMGYTATGYIKNFDSVVNMVVSGQKISKMAVSNSGLESDVVLTWNGASQAAGPAAKIGSWTENLKNHPALKGFAIYVPFYVGAIPFTLKFTAGLIFTPAFTSKNTMLDGQVHMHYGGAAGFTVDNGQSAATGAVTPEPPKNPVTKAISLGPFGFVIAAEFPRLELGLGINLWNVGDSVGFGLATFSPTAYLNAVTAFGITYGGPVMVIPCQTHTLSFSVNTGVAASSTIISFFKSATKLTIDKEIYKHQWTAAAESFPKCP